MRKNIVKYAGYTVGIVLLVWMVYVGYQVITTMSTKNLEETVDLPDCLMVTGVIGPEDFEYLPDQQGFVITSIDRRAGEDATGALYWLDISVPPSEQVPELIDISYPERFRPHGVTFQNGNLYVISHREEGEHRHTIEVFTLDSTAGDLAWEHSGTITGDLLLSPNDLVALDDGSLFIANDFSDIGGMDQLMLDYVFFRKRAPLVYYDGETFTDMNENVRGSAGITAVIRDGQLFLFRSDMMNKLDVFEVIRDGAAVPTLDRVDRIRLDSMPDNLTADDQGNVYVATHYSVGLLQQHMVDAGILSPSQILKVDADGNTTLIYANRGEEIPAASVGAVVDGWLYIGQIYNDGILACPYE